MNREVIPRDSAAELVAVLSFLERRELIRRELLRDVLRDTSAEVEQLVEARR